MTRHSMMRKATGTALLTALFLTAGCVRFGTNPPDRLLGLTSTSSVEAGKVITGTSGSAITVLPPLIARSIGTPRVAVTDSSGAFAYVKDAIWVDTPDKLFQGLLSETIAVRTGRLVLNPGQFISEPNRQLIGQLISFGIDAGRKEAVVTYDASLLAPDGATINKQRFSATAPIGKIDAKTVAPAISAAANSVAEQVADWIKAQPG